MTGTAMIVDGQNLLMRAIFASKNTWMSSQGVQTGPLVIFANVLARHVREERPDRLVLTWDGGTSVSRQMRLPSYKAHRKTVPEEEAEHRDVVTELVREFCAHAGISTIRLNGIEADDLIAGAWGALTPADADRIVILSQDKDFLQLVGPNPHVIPTELIRMGSADTPTDRWTDTRFCTEYAYNTWNWPLVTALAGDPGDGVPGIPGIGPKKAVKLLEDVDWDWDRLLSEFDADPKRKGWREIAEASRDVVDLRHIPLAIPVPRWRPTDQASPGWQKMIEFFNRYQLRLIKERMETRTFWMDTESDDDLSVHPV